MKLVLKIGAVLLVVLLVVVAALLIWMDQIARSGVETGATYALGVPTRLNSISIGLFRGEVELSGLEVDNPEQFTSPHFLTLGRGEMAVSLGTLRQDVVHVPRLAFSDMTLTMERSKDGANYKVIMENLKRLQSKHADEVETEEDGGKRFIIDEVVIENVSVEAEMIPQLGKVTRAKLHIPLIKINNIGRDNDGAKMAEVSAIMVQAVLQSAMEAGAKQLPADMVNELQNGLSSLDSLATMGVGLVGDLGAAGAAITQEVGKGVGEAAKGVGEAAEGIGKTAGEALDGLGSLLKPKDDAEEPQP